MGDTATETLRAGSAGTDGVEESVDVTARVAAVTEEATLLTPLEADAVSNGLDVAAVDDSVAATEVAVAAAVTSAPAEEVGGATPEAIAEDAPGAVVAVETLAEVMAGAVTG